jgi:hypothetical protein
VNLVICYMFTNVLTILRVCYFLILVIFLFQVFIVSMWLGLCIRKLIHCNPLYWCGKASYVQLCRIYFDYFHCVNLYWISSVLQPCGTLAKLYQMCFLVLIRYIKSNVQLLVHIFFRFLTFLFSFKIQKMIPRNGGMVVSNVILIV